MYCNWAATEIQKPGSGQSWSIHSVLKWDSGPPRPSEKTSLHLASSLSFVHVCMYVTLFVFSPKDLGSPSPVSVQEQREMDKPGGQVGPHFQPGSIYGSLETKNASLFLMVFTEETQTPLSLIP